MLIVALSSVSISYRDDPQMLVEGAYSLASGQEIIPDQSDFFFEARVLVTYSNTSQGWPVFCR